ncbi:MAG: queuosine precursor transporter [Candidatus Woesearchaeota archaeon]
MLLEFFVSAFIVLLFLKFFKKEGAFVALAILIVASNLGVAKLYNLFSFELTAANMSMGLVFVLYSIIVEVYGRKEGIKAVWLGFLAQFVFLVLGFVYLSYTPSENDFIQEHIKQIFNFTPRIAIASWIAFIASGYISVELFNFFKKKKTKLWFRNNFSTKVAQIIDNFIFVTVAFFGIVDFFVYLQIFITTTIVEFLLDYLDTWIVYLGVRILKKN